FVAVKGTWIPDQWPSAYTIPLVREYSDHSPLMLHVSTSDFGPTLFRFYNSWLIHGDFRSILETCWAAELTNSFSKAHNFKSKLQRLKLTLKQWRKDSLIAENAKLQGTLRDIDLKAETSTLTHQEVEQRLMTVKDLVDFEHL
ncbi:hypothetical protein Tco_1279947, partial [Tanacetum coccineum]